MPVKILEVNDDNDGRRLDNYLMSVYKEIPKSKIYSIIRKGEVRVNSGRVKPNTKISSGDLIRIPPYLNEDRNGPKHKVNITLKTLITDNIIFEDNNFIILEFPIRCTKFRATIGGVHIRRIPIFFARRTKLSWVQRI